MTRTGLGIAAVGLWASLGGAALAERAGPVVVGSAAPLSAPVAPVPLSVLAVCAYGIGGSAGRVEGGAPCRTVPSERALAASAADRSRSSLVPVPASRLPARPPIPASNPVGIVPQAVPVAHGFERVWEDGRVNPARGVPQAVSGAVVLGATLVAAH